MVCTEDQFYPENRNVSCIYLSVYSFVENMLKISIKPRPIVTEISVGFSQTIWQS